MNDLHALRLDVTRIRPGGAASPRRRVALLVVPALALVLGACAGASGTPTPPPTLVPTIAPTTAPTDAPATDAPGGEAETVAMGEFHDVDGSAMGVAALKHLADDSFTLVLDEFSIDSADHLNVILVSNEDVMATTDVDQDAMLDLGPLKGTSGMQDYPVPSEMNEMAMGYHSVVIWDTEMLHAIAAAPLQEGA